MDSDKGRGPLRAPQEDPGAQGTRIKDSDKNKGLGYPGTRIKEANRRPG